jgi:ABC-2 type transport system permease protein
MAGIEMESKDGGEPTPMLSSFVSSRQHFQTIAWLRWRIFVNTLRGKGAVGELVVKILSYPLLGLIILGPSVGSGFAAYYFVSQKMDAYLSIPLWIIFFLWQFIGISTSATGPNFDLATLIRFPIRYRDYLLIRLSFGLLDPPTLAGIGCLAAMTIGVAIAAPAMAPWAALLLFTYAACNVLFSRMIYSWLERWLAQRRTRELLTMLLLVVSLAVQFVGQFADRWGRHAHHGAMSPFMAKASHILLAVNWLLPPGLTTTSFEHMHRGLVLPAMAALGGLLGYTAFFLISLNIRLKAEYRGENLSEAPAALTGKALAKEQKQRAAELVAAKAGDSYPASSLLSPAVAGCLVKELRYLSRSGPKLYALVMPVFMIVLISVRTAGLRQAGLAMTDIHTFLFSSGCAYALMILVGFIYNSFGADGPGVQFYFLAPIRFRDMVFAKNLMIAGVLLVEMTLMYLASAFLGAQAPLSLTVATVAWTLFAFLLNVGVGNVRSIVSPKYYEAGKVRRQNVSVLNSLISLFLIAAAAGLGSLMVRACRHYHASYWIAAGVFLVLAAMSFGAYLLILSNIDGIAAKHLETLTLELCKK